MKLVILLNTIISTSAFNLLLENPNINAKLTNNLVNKVNMNIKASEYNYRSILNSGLNNAHIIQGGNSLKTWSYKSRLVEQVNVILSSNGRPVDTDIELWQGPQNSPCKMRIYLENGLYMPFYTVIETPRGPNTVAIRNIGLPEFPVTASVNNNIINPSFECLRSFNAIQGGALCNFPIDTNIESSQVMLKTDGRPLNARIEVVQGPNNNKQVIELYNDDGFDRPFFCILKTPGAGCVIRIINTAPIEFPLFASVTKNSMNQYEFTDSQIGGDVIRNY